jgi:Lactate racemase N-terminal domain
MTDTIGAPREVLDPDVVAAFVTERFDALDLDGRSLCLVIPDATRNCPVALLLAAVEPSVRDRVRSCTAVIALGTHAPMSEAAVHAMVGPRQLPRGQPCLLGPFHLPRGGDLERSHRVRPLRGTPRGDGRHPDQPADHRQ